MGATGILQTVIPTVSDPVPRGDCREGRESWRKGSSAIPPIGFGLGWPEWEQEDAGLSTSLLEGERGEKPKP